MEKPLEILSRSFDACIVCALHEEVSAVIDEFSSRCNVSFAKAYHGLDRYEYLYTTIQNRDNEPLTVLVTWLPEIGPTAMAQEVKSLVQQFHPRFMAMSGICAGDRRKVQYGDLVVAGVAYHYEEGKITSGPGGHQPATRTFSPSDQVLQYVRGFTSWEQPIAQMKKQFLKQDLLATDQPKRFVAAMASGMAVRADDPFLWLQQRYHRQTIGLDMEAASFYAALRSFTNTLVVKGVCDYADMTKDDTYHDYAARVSAVYLLGFLQEYVTKQTMIPQYASESAEALQDPEPTHIRVSSGPSREGNKGMILFMLKGIEHTLEYIRHDNIKDQILCSN
jgi:nucleoside phosphorylase